MQSLAGKVSVAAADSLFTDEDTQTAFNGSGVNIPSIDEALKNENVGPSHASSVDEAKMSPAEAMLYKSLPLKGSWDLRNSDTGKAFRTKIRSDADFAARFKAVGRTRAAQEAFRAEWNQGA